MGFATTLLHSTELRLNRELLEPAPDGAFWALFTADGAPLGGPPPELAAAGERGTDLLVACTTYNRPGAFRNVVTKLALALESTERAPRVHFVVAEDAGTDDYESVHELARDLFGDRLTWLAARSRLGKKRYWQTYRTLFLAARELRPKRALFLQDDLDFSETLLDECSERFESLGATDPERRVLYLLSSADDEPDGRWIHFHRGPVLPPGVRKTQWFDLNGFFVDRGFFELLDYRVFAVSEERWQKRPERSSGVGEQLTRRLFHRCSVYQAVPPITFHGTYRSEMNPEARAVRPLDNHGFRGDETWYPAPAERR